MLMSLLVFIFALVSNPFSLPFQDFDQMPETQQKKYIRDADFSNRIITLSALAAAGTTSVFALTSYLIHKAGNKSESR